MMVAVVVIFGLCWLPYHTYFIAVQVDPSIRMLPYIQQVFLLIYWLAMSNSMYNPIIYCLMNARYGTRQTYIYTCPPHLLPWGFRLDGNHSLGCRLQLSGPGTYWNSLVYHFERVHKPVTIPINTHFYRKQHNS